MRDGVAGEVERTEAHDARLNAHALPAKQQKNGPEKVRELSGQDERPQRGPWRNLFRRQCHTKMAQKQASLLSSLVAGPGWSGRLFEARPPRRISIPGGRRRSAPRERARAARRRNAPAAPRRIRRSCGLAIPKRHRCREKGYPPERA